jgi:hypothetical protein
MITPNASSASFLAPNRNKLTVPSRWLQKYHVWHIQECCRVSAEMIQASERNERPGRPT